MDIIGRVPTLEEIRHFERTPDRAELINRLLDCERFTHFWSEVWAANLNGYGDAFDSDRKSLRNWLEQAFAADVPFDNQNKSRFLDRCRSMISGIDNRLRAPFLTTLDLDSESAGVTARYGDHPFGRGCLLARRLVEMGVIFVEVLHDGWDTHANNFTAIRQQCEAIDQSWTALMEDLFVSGLLSETIVLWMGEFGRTPNINANRGRDHFPRVTPVAIGGAGIRPGGIVGATNDLGTQIDGASYNVPDLFATLFTVLGIDPSSEFETDFGSPARATDNGTVISELV